MDLGKMVNVAIGLSMMFLMLSLFCTIINEFINGWFDLRSRNLKAGLWKLAESEPEFLKIFSHSTIIGAALNPRVVDQHLVQVSDSAEKTANAVSRIAAAAAAAKAKPASPVTATSAIAAVSAVSALPPQLIAAAAAAAAVSPEDVAAAASAITAADITAAAAAPAVAADRARVEAAATSVKSLIGDDPQHQQSYISGRTFASAVLDTINPKLQFNDTATYQAVMSAIDTLPGGRLKQVLRGTVNNTTADIQAVRDSIAHWFDDEMERVQGVYKRWQQVIALCVGLLLAAALNVDTLYVASVLWKDHDLAGKIADSATRLMAEDKAQGQVIGQLVEAEKKVSAKAAAYDAAAREAVANPTDADKAKASKDAEAELNSATTLRDKLVPAVSGNVAAYKNALAPLPIGWTDEILSRWSLDSLAQNWRFLIVQVGGWVLTALALAMGAPFWFDTLNRFVNIRSAGARPATTAEAQGAK